MQLLARATTSDLLPKHQAPEEERSSLLRHAHHLPEEDRLLLDLFFRRRLTRQDIARLMGLSVGTVSRRLTRLSTRLRDPLVVALLETPDPVISPLHRSLGIQHFLCRRPVTHLARGHHLTPRRVREILTYLEGWHRGARGR